MLAHLDSSATLASSEFVTVAQIARRLDVTERFVRELIARGDLPAVKIGAKAIRVRRTDVDALLRPVTAA